MKMERIKKKRAVLRFAAAACAVAFIVFAIMLLRELRQSKQEAETFSELAKLRLPQASATTQPNSGHAQTPKATPIRIVIGSSAVAQADATQAASSAEGSAGSAAEQPTATPAEEGSTEPAPLERYLPLYELNSDYFAWITIPGTRIDYPVMYNAQKPLQYLGHDFYGNFSYAGVPFLDSDCDPNGNFYLVYGHKMSNGSMFADLVAYDDRSFWETHPVFQFDTLYEERTYAVVMAIRAKVLDREERNGFRYYNYTSLDTEAEFEEYMRQARALALYDTGIDVSYGDELLVLSTCYHYTKDGRFVIIAKRVS